MIELKLRSSMQNNIYVCFKQKNIATRLIPSIMHVICEVMTRILLKNTRAVSGDSHAALMINHLIIRR